ncbi:hypothetical protein P171DRAFT_5840 [Karstenula rhodostoma CBS 690.94]|uniref:Uncharacterized protein n=1 Tax=Karstenula rhodostoma CBS 690.94 TaxID=1392251 RepID=A0A9P4UJK7_9PLEO|nr:hypothetical protein P171DRAFT_5840 [Karstenula rhodostoma CBS 690.94]
MCKYFKKVFTCGHLSQVYVERCPAACKPGTEACTTHDSSHDAEQFASQLRQEARRSHFECFGCLEGKAAAESEAAVAAEQDPQKRAEMADKHGRLASKAAKADANRKTAEQKMKAEREADAAAAEALKAEKERAARGDGVWIESGSARKKKGKHGRGFHDPRSPAQSAPPTPTFRMGVDAGVGGRAGKMGEFRNEPRSANEVDAASGVGAWPKKILSKGEGQRENWGWK